jgi:hypothetical protein
MSWNSRKLTIETTNPPNYGNLLLAGLTVVYEVFKPRSQSR